MYLTEKLKGVPRAVNKHGEIEILLETYLKQIEEIATECGTLHANMKSTEDITMLMLDLQRNALMTLELKIASYTLAMACASFIASMFGMNLPSGFEASPNAFWIVTACASVGALVAAAAVTKRMRQYLRWRMDTPSLSEGKAKQRPKFSFLSKVNNSLKPKNFPGCR